MDEQRALRRGTALRVPGYGEQEAAARTVQQLTSAPTALLTNPRLGERLEEFEPRDVRRILIGHYEMRYEILDSCIYVLRLWHTREDR